MKGQITNFVSTERNGWVVQRKGKMFTPCHACQDLLSSFTRKQHGLLTETVLNINRK